MDIKKFSGNFQSLIQKYKYAVVILAVGLLLMALPSTKTTKQSQAQKIVEGSSTSFDENLSALLSHVCGAGEVKVILATETEAETVYQTNDDQSSGDNSNNTRTQTVTVTDSERNQQGLVRQVKSPIYRGAVVVCQGADSADVRLSLVDAVSKVTGLRSDQISVLKMK